jgi:two-component system, OmpR family, phosphate regulon sensor histidine kinase PhoR
MQFKGTMPVLSQFKAAFGSFSRSVAARRNELRDASNATAQHSWREAEKLAVSVLDSLPDPALILDDADVILHGNALAAQVFGDVRRGEHVSRTTRNPELVAAVASVREHGSKVPFELLLHSPVERRLEGVATRLPAQDKSNSAAVLVILQDLSERDALSRMRVEFVANASHELRTPLAALTGFIETLAGPAKNDAAAQQRFLGIMAAQAARMTRLVDDLLALSRVEMRAHLSPSTTADLNHVGADAVQNMQGEASKGGITLKFETSGADARIRGDHDELVQAVQNLVHNAIKYGRRQGSVAVIVSRQQGPKSQAYVQLRVVDDGPGIEPEHVPRLTERFYRVNTVTSREVGGTGLGLAIVKHIVTRHHGTIEIASMVGTGSTFTLRFPSL